MNRAELKLVDVGEQELLIVSYDSETVSQLFDFGKVLVTEVQQRSGQMDAKLGAYLGFCASLSGLLFVGSAALTTLLTKALVLIALGSAVTGMIYSLYGLYSRISPMPSERDWFRRECINDPDRLKQYHVISLLFTHQGNQQANMLKGKAARTCEVLLGVATLLTAFVLLLRIF